MGTGVTKITVGEAQVFLGDCRDVLRELADNSVDSVVTDPPYELGFMGKKWDSTGIAYDVTVWEECLRVLKPGGHILAFGGSRTFHRMAVAIEDAGFEIRDSIAWISSKTFPKSLDVRKAIDKTGVDGSAWEGWGTGLKNVVEPIVMGRKPLVGTVAANVLEHGVGGLNIDASRVAGNVPSVPQPKTGGGIFSGKGGRNGELSSAPSGRWPANVIFDEYSAGLLDEQSGVLTSGALKPHVKKAGPNKPHVKDFMNGMEGKLNTAESPANSGGASRFFYCAKASKRDRNEGLDGLEEKDVDSGNYGINSDSGVAARGRNPDKQEYVAQNFHPTVKPTALMRYLIKLVTPAGGTVLDPFTGSGSTGKAALLDGYKFVGVELTEEYLPIIEGRLTWALNNVEERAKDETLF
jgi:site-specific DNA-methyltransferase (adenine-specific)